MDPLQDEDEPRHDQEVTARVPLSTETPSGYGGPGFGMVLAVVGFVFFVLVLVPIAWWLLHGDRPADDLNYLRLPTADGGSQLGA